MFLFPRREAPPEDPRGVHGRFSCITLFAFSREKRKNKEFNRTCYLSSALAEHTRGRPPQIQNFHSPQPRFIWFLLLAQRVFLRRRCAGMTYHWCVVDGDEPRSHGHGATMVPRPGSGLRIAGPVFTF